MTWIPKTLGELPTILAGPIVRKVTPNSVSVWLVVKSKEDLTLRIYHNSGPLLFSPGNPVELTEKPVELGKHIFIACITITSSTDFLSYGSTYGYDIENSLGKRFSSDGFATMPSPTEDAIDSLVYSDSPSFGSVGKLPTFVLPAQDLNSLRVMHGSCRKPHGEGLDALTTVGDAIAESFSVGTIMSRPQMLFLTGDQIYADDVADALLYKISYYKSLLFEWNETHILVDPASLNLAPGRRGHYVSKSNLMNFEAEEQDSKSHLMWLQEYILMYVMAWSPSLWKENPLTGSLEDFFVQVTSNANPKEIEVNPFNILQFESPIEEVDTSEFVAFKKEFFNLKNFKNGLKGVRRTLANVATYMIFDDHEVTDDWFLNYSWSQNALKPNSLQRRVIQNGMVAYAICQGWGNTPEQFKPNVTEPQSSPPGAKLLSKLDDIGSTLNFQGADVWDVDIPNIVLPILTTSGNSGELVHSSSGLKYNWFYSGPNFEVIALDTRTQRAYLGTTAKTGVSLLMSNDAVEEQVNDIVDPKKDITFLISGTPLYGAGSVEASIQLVRMSGKKTNAFLDLESWNIVEYARHTLISALVSRAKDPIGGEKRNHKVVVLSGDVHYGFTNEVRYSTKPNKKTFKYDYENVEMTIIQCCSSSLKNQVSPAGFIDKVARLTTVTWHRHDPKSNLLYKLQDDFVQWGYNNENGNQLVGIKIGPTILGTKVLLNNIKDKPYIVSTADFVKQTIESIGNSLINSVEDVVPLSGPDWSLIQKSIKANALTDNYVSLTNGTGSDDYFDISSKHKDNYYLKGGVGGRYIVGYNQVGDVLLRWPAVAPGEYWDGNFMLDHRIWWRNFGMDYSALTIAYPLSIFIVTF